MAKSNPLPFHPQSAIIEEILKELKRAKQKHPRWPQSIVSRAAIVCEESGELIRAAVNYKYEPKEGVLSRKNQMDEMIKEATQTAATAIRFLESVQNLTSDKKQSNAKI